MQVITRPVTQICVSLGRYAERPFGIRQDDRLLHTYIIGQTGTGKSTLLLNMMRQDLSAGRVSIGIEL